MIVFELTPDQQGDIRPAPGLVASLPPAVTLLADAAYDSDALRALLTGRGTTPVIKQNLIRKRLYPFDNYKGRKIIERTISRLKDWRRAATRYDKLATNFRSTIALVSMVIWWTWILALDRTQPACR